MKLLASLADRLVARVAPKAAASAGIGVNGYYRCVEPHLAICGPFTWVKQYCSNGSCGSVGCC